MEIFKKIIKITDIYLVVIAIIIIGFVLTLFLVTGISKQTLIAILTLIAFFIVFIILPYFIKKHYKRINNYNPANKTKTKENNTSNSNTNIDTNEITTSKTNIRIDKSFKCIYNLKKASTNKEKGTVAIRVLIKKLYIYATLLSSYFCTLFLYRFINKFLNYLPTRSSTEETTGDSFRTYLDYTIYFGFILTIFVIMAIILTLIEYMVNYTNYWHIVLYLLVILGIAVAVKVFWKQYDVSIMHSIHIFLLYIGTLPINYIFINSIKKNIEKLYLWLHKDENNLDPSKLTLLWTIIVFILGVIFNIKQ